VSGLLAGWIHGIDEFGLLVDGIFTYIHLMTVIISAIITAASIFALTRGAPLVVRAGAAAVVLLAAPIVAVLGMLVIHQIVL
jgi:hypothetical protein